MKIIWFRIPLKAGLSAIGQIPLMAGILFTAIIFFTPAASHSQITYQKTIGGTGDEQNAFCVHTKNGSFIVGTTSSPGGAGGKDIFLTYLPNPPCYDNPPTPIQFTYAGIGATSWSWDFGDGNTSTQQNPSNTYATPGSFWVTLTVTDPSGICTATSTQQITVATPCCAFTITYNILPPTIMTSVTWTSNYKINQTITVNAPAILTIVSGVTIEFGPLGKIIVENGTGNSADVKGKGAELILNPNCTLTSVTKSFPSCPVMWPGIEVWGNSDNISSNAASSNPSLYGGQGKVTLNSGATIENAHIGVLLGKKSTCISGPLVKCAFYDIGNSGGIIDANGAVFKRNGISIRFFPYAKTNDSKIQACTFDGSVQVLDNGYSSGNASYTYPNPQNPYYAPSNFLKVSYWHIHLWGVMDVKIFDNIFKDVFSEAILAIDSRFNVKKLNPLGNGNIFSKVLNPGIPYSYGIHILNTVSPPSYFHEISDNTFNPCPIMGIAIEGNTGSDLIQRNSFDAQSNVASGIDLVNSSGFNINDNNQFNVLSHGIAVINSGMGGGNIGFPEGNTFTNCSYNHAITAWGIPSGNPFLQIKCNNFNNSLSQYYQSNPSNTYGLSNNIITNDAVPPSQGSYPTNQNEDKKPAGNEFLQITPSNLTFRNQIFSFTPYVYYRHHLDAQGGLKILPDQNSLITVTENPSVSKTPTSCDPYINPCPPPLPPCWDQRIQNLSDQINILQVEFNSVFAILDNGQKAALLSAINGNMSDGHLKNLLLQNSPLSDEVLTAFINRNGTSPGNFKNVMIPNMPVSNTVFPALLNKLITLPPGITTQIKNAQGYNPGYRTLTAVLRDINRIEMERAQVLSEAIAYYVQNNSIGKLTAILEQLGTDYANQLLFATYLSDNNLSAAAAKLNALPISTPEEQAYRSLNTMLIALASQGQTVFEMDNTQEQLVRQIATMPASCLARTNARTILLLVFNERFTEETIFPNVRMEMTNYSTLEGEKSENSLYPNPASEKVEFHFKLSDGESGTLEIFSVIGNKLASYTLSSLQKQFVVPIAELENGLYVYRFSVNRELKEEGKLVINK